VVTKFYFNSLEERDLSEGLYAVRAIPWRIKPYGVTTGLMWFRVRSRGKPSRNQ
jgi:hypothetical protein